MLYKADIFASQIFPQGHNSEGAWVRRVELIHPDKNELVLRQKLKGYLLVMANKPGISIKESLNRQLVETIFVDTPGWESGNVVQCDNEMISWEGYLQWGLLQCLSGLKNLLESDNGSYGSIPDKDTDIVPVYTISAEVEDGSSSHGGSFNYRVIRRNTGPKKLGYDSAAIYIWDRSSVQLKKSLISFFSLMPNNPIAEKWYEDLKAL